jgi:hypothetical protein
MGLTFRLGQLPTSLFTDASNNVGIGAAPSGSYKLEVTGTAKVSSNLQLGSTTASSTTTPITLNMGGTYGTTLLNGIKIKMFDDGTTFHGLGVIAGNLYLNATDAATVITLNTNNTERMRITSSGNVGIGVTPSAWGSNSFALQTQGGALWSFSSAYLDLWQNSYFNGTNSIYQTTAEASYYRQNAGMHLWYTAPSGTAGNTITFTERMRITSGGQVQIKQSANSHNEGLSLINTGNQVWNLVNGGDANFYFGYQGTSKANISPTTGVYTALSDVNKKKDFEQSTIGLSAILGLKPTLYRMKDEDESIDKHLGFIAQEVKEYIPQAYVESINEENTFIGLDYQSITVTLVKAIQELNERLNKAGL